MQYRIENTGVLDTITGASIPNDENNLDWVDYLDWVASGNTADPEFTAPEIEATRVETIKEIAGQKITETTPEWKQRNNLARMLELVSKTVDLSVLTVDEQLEITNALTDWAGIQSIRTTSDTAETDGTNPEDIVW